MPIAVSCQGCQKSYRVKEEYAGKRMRCPACKGILDVPEVLGANEQGDNKMGDNAAPPVPITGRVRGRTQRDYIHRVCETSTTIDGPEFEALADPLTKMTSTYCEHCDDHFSIDQFAWCDTQEKISDYYRRYQDKASPFQNFFASRMGMFALAGLLFLVGLVGALVLRSVWLVAAGLLLGLFAIVVHALVLGPMILRQVLGTSDARELN